MLQIRNLGRVRTSKHKVCTIGYMKHKFTKCYNLIERTSTSNHANYTIFQRHIYKIEKSQWKFEKYLDCMSHDSLHLRCKKTSKRTLKIRSIRTAFWKIKKLFISKLSNGNRLLAFTQGLCEPLLRAIFLT